MTPTIAPPSYIVKRIRTATLLFSALALLPGCGSDSPTDAASPGGRPDARTVSVAAHPIETGNIRDQRTYTGTLLPSQRFTVAARTAGLLQRLDAEIGDRVERNQVVGKIEQADILEEVNQARAEVSVALANLRSAEAALEVAEREVGRIQLLRDRDFVSASEREQVENRLIAAQALKSVAEANLELRQSALRRAEIRLDYTTLRTSWESEDTERFVSQRFLDEGSLVTANSPILEVVSLHPLIGQFYVPEADYYQISSGMPVYLTVGGHGGRQYPGEVRRRAPEFSADSRRALIEVHVPNSEHALAPGVFMRVGVVLAEQANAVLVPLDAIIQRGGQHGVFFIDEGNAVARFRPVTRGFREGTRIAVEGLEPSGLVVVLGQDQLVDGTPIHWEISPQSETPTPPAERPQRSGRPG